MLRQPRVAHFAPTRNSADDQECMFDLAAPSTSSEYGPAPVHSGPTMMRVHPHKALGPWGRDTESPYIARYRRRRPPPDLLPVQAIWYRRNSHDLYAESAKTLSFKNHFEALPVRKWIHKCGNSPLTYEDFSCAHLKICKGEPVQTQKISLQYVVARTTNFQA